MLQDCEDIPIYKQRLFFGGNKLNNSSTLKDYNIQRESTLELILVSIKLYVKKKDGKVIEFLLDENDTIHDVKQMIVRSFGKIIPVSKQRLLFCGEQLHDSSTLKSCNIQNESTLELAMVPFKLNVKTQDGKVINLSVTEDNTIYEVKRMIQEYEGIPSYKQRLFVMKINCVVLVLWESVKFKNIVTMG
ncbi:ubiquitin-like protein [Rhizophagus irregularis]|uniref:Ubiquitin-like protein n=1 Tax=Rhizophagus irregularis TaxID=588596 RepID=A0A2N1NX23_9GLOM|nr:ubiquitin-like protein [Rhizophagus irregularis]